MIEFHFSSPEESPGFLLWQVTMLWQRRIKRALAPLGITHTQFVLLAALGWLSEKEGTVTQARLADHSKTDRMMVSKVLRTLEGKGLLQRQAHETDTRAKSLALTDQGRQLLQQAIKVVENNDLEFFTVIEGGLSGFISNMQELMEKNAD